jgi:hypothetical protein
MRGRQATRHARLGGCTSYSQSFLLDQPLEQQVYSKNQMVAWLNPFSFSLNSNAKSVFKVKGNCSSPFVDMTMNQKIYRICRQDGTRIRFIL